MTTNFNDLTFLLGWAYSITLVINTIVIFWVDGNVFRIRYRCRNTNALSIFKTSWRITVSIILVTFFWISVILGVIFWLAWLTLDIIDHKDDDWLHNTTYAILLVATAIPLIFLAILILKRNMFKWTKSAYIILGISFFMLIAYSILAIFNEDKITFRSTTVIALYFNAILIITLIFMNRTKRWYSKTLEDLNLESRIQEDNSEDNESMYNENEEKAECDLFQEWRFLASIKSPKQMFKKLFEGSESFLSPKSKKTRLIMTFIMYFLSIFLLFCNAIILTFIEDEPYYGFLIMLTVIATDILLFFHRRSRLRENFQYNLTTKITSSPLIISMHVIVIRTLLIVFDVDHWIYGYWLLYLYVTTISTLHILRLLLPYTDQIADSISISHVTRTDQKKSFNPIYSLIVTNFLWAFAFIGVIELFQWLEKEYETLGDFSIRYAGLFCILLSILIFVLYAVVRLFTRKKQSMGDKLNFRWVKKQINLYYILLLLTYILFLGLCVIIWQSLYFLTFLWIGIFLPPSIICLHVAMIHFSLNDHKYLLDIEWLNAKIMRHNKEVEIRIDSLNKIQNAYERKAYRVSKLIY